MRLRRWCADRAALRRGVHRPHRAATTAIDAGAALVEGMAGRLDEEAPAGCRIRSGLAFSTLIDALVVALVALLPGEQLATAGIILGVTGISSMADLTVVGIRAPEIRRHPTTLLRPVLLSIVFVPQLVDSAVLAGHPHGTGPVSAEAG